MSLLGAVNNRIKYWAYQTQGLFWFSMRTLGSLVRRPFYVTETLEQMYLIGVGSLFLVGLTGIFSGQGFALAFSNELEAFGAKDYLGRVMSIAIIRELGPTLTGLMVAARVAAGITAEIGAMKSSNQLDAMKAFGIDPIKKIARPRLISLLIMLPVLTVICDLVAIVGGWIIGLFIANVSSTMYWSAIIYKLNFGNMLMGFVKPVAFSFIIAFISCYLGFTAEGGTKGVGRATTNSVMMSSVTILVVNFIITKSLGPLIKGYL